MALVISCGGSTDDGVRLGGAGDSPAGGSSGVTSAGGSAAGGAAGAGAAGAGAAGAGFGGAAVGGAFGAGTDGAGPIDPPGPRLCGGHECPQGQACCLATSACFDPLADPGACAPPPPDNDPQGRKPCSSNAHCAANEFCMSEDGRICQTSGHCQPIDNCGFCSGGLEACKVCGCDGNTYPDTQTACRAGTNTLMSYHGAGCGETIDVGGGGGGGRGPAPPLRVTPCGTDANCPSGQICCAITAICYPADDPARCRPTPPGTRFPCTADDQCFQGAEYCKGDGCTGPGGCVSLGSQGDCGVTLEPVCGCDGVTYTSAACASTRGVRVAATGQCPAMP